MVGWVALGLAVLATLLVGPVPRWLAGAGWVYRAPRAAMLLWQVIGLTAALSAVGAGLGIAVAPLAATVPHGVHRLLSQLSEGQLPVPLTWPHVLALAWALGVSGFVSWRCGWAAVSTWRKRRRLSQIVDLVGEPWTGGGARVSLLRHPTPTAYCLPGWRSRIVLSTGAVDVLGTSELAAVVAHEQAHARARHDLAVLPFTALAHAVPRITTARRAREATELLVEMLADDAARRLHGDRVLARALLRIAAHHDPSCPPGALAAEGGTVLIRIHRLLYPTPSLSPWRRALPYLAALGLLCIPLAVGVSPLLVTLL